MIRTLAVLAPVVGGFAVNASAQPTIEQLAPERSVFVAGADDFDGMLAEFKRTRLWSLWKSDPVQALVQEPLKELDSAVDEALMDLGLDRATLAAPRGPVGIAVFGPSAPAAGDAAAAAPGVLVVADFGPKAPHMSRVFEAMIERAEEKLDTEPRRRELLGRTVYTLDLSAMLPQQGEADARGFPEGQAAPVPLPDPGKLAGFVKQVHYVRDGRRFLLCTDFEALHEALEVVDDVGTTGFADRDDFRAVRAQLGPVQAWAAFLVRDLGRIKGQPDPMFMMMQSMFQSIVGDIRAIAGGLRFNGPEIMAEERFAVYMPGGKSGLTDLMDLETPLRRAPAFVSPRAISYGRLNFEFDGVVPFLRSLARTNPMFGPQLDQFLMEHGPMLERAMLAVGPEVHMMTTLSRPITLDSLKWLYAIESSRPDEVETVLARYAATLGLEPRDFIGHRIYTMSAMNMGGPAMPAESNAIGLGGGWVFIGTASLVEDALRAGGGADLPGLEDDPDYRRAVAAITAPEAVAWGVTDIVKLVEYFQDLPRMAQEQMIEQMNQWDPEYAREMEAEMAAAPPSPLEDFPVEELRRYLGPVAWQVVSREDGFVGRYFMLEPTAALDDDDEWAGADD